MTLEEFRQAVGEETYQAVITLVRTLTAAGRSPDEVAEAVMAQFPSVVELPKEIIAMEL